MVADSLPFADQTWSALAESNGNITNVLANWDVRWCAITLPGQLIRDLYRREGIKRHPLPGCGTFPPFPGRGCGKDIPERGTCPVHKLREVPPPSEAADLYLNPVTRASLPQTSSVRAQVCCASRNHASIWVFQYFATYLHHTDQC